MRVGNYLAKRLNELGCELGAIAVKKSVYDFIKSQDEIPYKVVVDYDEIMDHPKAYLGEDEYTLEDICNDLGIHSVWPFVQSLRHHIRSYKRKYYYDYGQDVSDEEIVLYVKAVYKNVKKVFKEFSPELIIAPNIATLFHIFYNLYGKKYGVKMIRIIDSRVSGVGVMSYDYNCSEGRFFDRIRELETGAESENTKKAEQYIQETGAKLIAPMHSDYKKTLYKKQPLIKRIRRELSPYRKIWDYWTKRDPNPLKNFTVTIDSRSPYYILRDHYAHKINSWRTKSYRYDDFDGVRKCIYVPLQFTPEETIDVFAPHYNNQLELIRQVAMSAPDDYTVVVKEHPTMVGRRSLSYMKKISRIPNVKFVDYRIASDDIMKKADLVVNVSGTSLAEAGFLRKPALQFGNLGITKAMPNVFFHSDYLTLSEKIKHALVANLHTEEYERKLLNFVTAAYDVGSIEADYRAIWIGMTKDNIECLWKFYKKEIEYIFTNYPPNI